MNYTETIIFESSSQEVKTILLMAGIHPVEEAGVECLKQLTTDNKWAKKYRNFNLIVVPCRNIMGYYILETLFNDGIIAGRLVADTKSVQLYELNEDYYMIPKHDPYFNNDRQWTSIINCLDDYVSEGFVNILSRTKGTIIRANSYYYKSKRLIDLNNIGLIPPHDGIKDIGQVILEHHPDYIIDLHEGKDDNNYVYVTKGALNIGNAIINKYTAKGMAIRENAKDRVAIDRGVYAFEALNCYKSWQSYLDDSELIIIESGIKGNVAQRVRSLKTGIEACLDYIGSNVRA